MRLWIAYLALLAACGFGSSKTGEDDGGGIDSTPTPMPDASTRFGTMFAVVLSSYPTEAEMVTTIDLDIDTTPPSLMCDARIAEYCVVARTSFTVAPGRRIRGHGTRPLVLVATTTFDLMGDLDVSSSVDGPAGAGAQTGMLCLNVALPPTSASETSGGFGGSFGGKGGDGDLVNGTRGVAAAAIGFPSALRGGCPGGTGGGGGTGGNGGGAVDIIASSINLNGRINASGAGGHGGLASKTGGGGGGSGGMIVLDVTPGQITRGAMAILFASGGAGGEGGTGGGSPAAGVNGQTPTAPEIAAPGGASLNLGGNGGDGSSGRVLFGANATGQVSADGDGGGGGGGGGAGIIHAPGFAGDNVIAPPSTNPP